MFPLQLLALLFISSHQPTQEEEEEAEGGQRSEGDMVVRRGQRSEEDMMVRRGQRSEEDMMVRRGQRSEEDTVFRRGDLLQVPRTLFTHFGIYLGRGRVVHFIPDIIPVVSSDERRIKQMVTNFRLLLGVLIKRGSIRVDSVNDFAYGSEILINTMDKVCSFPPLSGEEVALRAEKLQGHVSYSLLWYNCEHFVMYCRYGTLTSFQTFQFCKTMRKLLMSRRVAKVTAVLGVCLLLYLQAVTMGAALLAALLPSLFWMAS